MKKLNNDRPFHFNLLFHFNKELTDYTKQFLPTITAQTHGIQNKRRNYSLMSPLLTSIYKTIIQPQGRSKFLWNDRIAVYNRSFWLNDTVGCRTSQNTEAAETHKINK
jgi:hypothetical protein